MGLFFTLFYVLTAFLGPQTIFGSLAEYHVQIVIALITLACSLPSAPGSGLLRLPQTYAILALSAAVFLSLAFNGWIGGGPIALMEFLPNAMVFFFIVINCKKKIHLQLLIGVLLFASLYTIFAAYFALRVEDLTSPYLLTTMTNDFGGQVIRIRGLSFISDPNDLAQLLIGLIPCLFFFWGKGRGVLNLLFVYLPIAALVWGMYLTHSRGGMVALLAVAIVAGRRKIGVVPSVVVGVVLFAALSALGFSGGREVSAASGSDRMDAWGVGLELIRKHPFFGVGYHNFTEYNDITAHNSIVVCAAELGLIGLFSWMLFVLPTVRDAVVGSGPNVKKEFGDEAAEGLDPTPASAHQPSSMRYLPGNLGNTAFVAATGQQVSLHGLLAGSAGAFAHSPLPELRSATAPVYAPPGVFDEAPKTLSAEEIRRLSGLMVVSLAGFLTAGWFLSRAYVMTLYVIGGIAEVLFRMARRQGLVPGMLSLPRAMKLSSLTCMGFLVLVYLILRVNHLLPK